MIGRHTFYEVPDDDRCGYGVITAYIEREDTRGQPFTYCVVRDDETGHEQVLFPGDSSGDRIEVDP